MIRLYKLTEPVSDAYMIITDRFYEDTDTVEFTLPPPLMRLFSNFLTMHD